MTSSHTADTTQSLPLGRLAAVLVVGALAPIFDSTIVTIALATLVKELHSTVATIQWVTSGYLLALTITIPLAGWAQTRFGGKRVWIAALALFMTGSILSSLAWDAPSLIFFRVVQGMGGGILLPVLQSLMVQAAGGRQLGRIMSAVSLPVALGPILGPVIGGIILHWFSWPFLFWVNVPFCVVGIVLALRIVPDDAPADPRARLDVAGFVLLAPALAGLLLGLSNAHGAGGFTRADVWLPVALGLALLVAFAIYAWRRGSDALVDVRLLAEPVFARASALLFFSGMTLFGAMLLLPLYWQSIRGVDVLTAALYLIPQGVGTFLSRSLAGQLTDRIGPRWVAVGGFAVVALGTLPFALADTTTNVWWLMAVLLVRGAGLGAVLIPVMAAAYVGVARADVPHASMITRIAQQLGGSFGTAVLAVVLQVSSGAAATPSAATGGFQLSFWCAVGLTVVAIGVALLPPGRPAREVEERAPVDRAVVAATGD